MLNPDIARARIVYGQDGNERRTDAKHRRYLRASGFNTLAVRAVAKGQRKRRKQRHREAWPVGRPMPVLIPWPQCTGTTKAGERCRRGAIVDRSTNQPLEGQACRWHGGAEALQHHLQRTAEALKATAAQLEQVLDDLLEAR